MSANTQQQQVLRLTFVACLWLSLKYAGTVITAFLTVSFRNLAESSASFRNTWCKTEAAKVCAIGPFVGAVFITKLPSATGKSIGVLRFPT